MSYPHVPSGNLTPRAMMLAMLAISTILVCLNFSAKVRAFDRGFEHPESLLEYLE